MKQTLQKFIGLRLLMVLTLTTSALTGAWADVETITMSEKGYSNSEKVRSQVQASVYMAVAVLLSPLPMLISRMLNLLSLGVTMPQQGVINQFGAKMDNVRLCLMT